MTRHPTRENATPALEQWITRRAPRRLLAIVSSWLTAVVAVGIAFLPNPRLVGR
ncbi:hypothetical protein ACFPOI_59825 [Nonomuraea angiospora]|uniref:Uncharacterized protein n=1 Tax=Nonomuraea angiospora TaxID=46172 RepID=A0ABR9LQ57_9ACTN|nr:hypothetical protein [Nonomuraea angiospora]MBE1582789.1 hypothetical protein [Nonomuraea angiospora]